MVKLIEFSDDNPAVWAASTGIEGEEPELVEDVVLPEHFTAPADARKKNFVQMIKGTESPIREAVFVDVMRDLALEKGTAHLTVQQLWAIAVARVLHLELEPQTLRVADSTPICEIPPDEHWRYEGEYVPPELEDIDTQGEA